MTTRPPAPGSAKGTLLVHLATFAREAHGEAAWRRVLSEVIPADRAVLEELVLVSGWYPVGVWNRATELFVRGAYNSPGKGMTLLATHVADRDLALPFKMLLKIGSPAFLMARTPSIWSRYFDSGTFRSEEIAPRRWRMSLEAPLDSESAPGPLSCGEGVCAWVKHGLGLTGVKAQVVQVECRFRGAPRCEYSATW